MHRTAWSRRRSAITASAAIVVVASVCHISAHTESGRERSLLSLSPIADSERDWMLLQRRPGVDSAERTIGQMHSTEHALTNDSLLVAIIAHWLPPNESSDSLIVTRGTLIPHDEESVSRNLRFHYRYDGSRVTGAIQRGDSVPRSISRSFGETVYAFNELDELVRSLRFRTGLSLVVPLFSEADADLEHDTLTVVRDTTSHDGTRAWIVRFADPVIVTRYVVGARSREIMVAEIRQRRSGILFRLAPAIRSPVLVAPGLLEGTTQVRPVPDGRTQPDTTTWTVERTFVAGSSCPARRIIRQACRRSDGTRSDVRLFQSTRG